MLKNQKEFYNETQHQNILLLGECSFNKDIIKKAITGALYKYGYINENKYLDINAEFMKGSYVGHTSKRSEGIISYASGGVLFISNTNLLTDTNDNFGQEVITNIATAINENTDVTIVIMDDNSSEFLESIKNSFTIIYEFPEYNTEQLYQIFVQLSENDGFTITENASNKIYNIIESSIHYAAEINNFYNNVKKNHINNYNGDESTKYIIDEADISLTRQTIKLKLNK